jgi:hypothetical protein
MRLLVEGFVVLDRALRALQAQKSWGDVHR